MKKFHVVILFCFLCFILKGQQYPVCFDGTINYSMYNLTSNDNSSCIQSFDINNDGNSDILYPSFSSAVVRYKLGLGNGLFSSTVYTISTSGAPGHQNIDILDINNDGNKDILVYDAFSNISYIKNNGNGTFAAPYVIPSSYATSYSFVDFDNDGFKDLVSINTNTIYITKNNGNNTFSLSATLTSTSNIASIASGDFNWDGFNDIIYHTNGTSVNILNGDGSFGFSTAIQFTCASSLAGTVLYAFDFNNDGKDDFAPLQSSNEYYTSLYCSIGANTFSITANITSLGMVSGYDYRKMYFADVNNDGYKDLLLNGTLADIIKVSFGDASYSYQSYKTYNVVLKPKSITLNDFNNDGYLDVVVGSGASGNNKYSLLAGNALGFDGTEPLGLKKPLSTNQYSSCKAKDINNDGYDDLIITADTLSVLENNTTGGYNLIYQKRLNGSAYTPKFSDVTDINNDNNEDIVFPNSIGGNIGVLIGNGNGTFQSTLTITSSYQNDNIFCADMDNDGYKEIIANSSSGLKIFKNNSGTSFTSLTVPNTAWVVDYTVGDFNSDGFLDIAYFNSSTNIVKFLVNGSGTSFSISTNSVSLCGTSIIRTITSGDYDLDGKTDLIVGHSLCSTTGYLSFCRSNNSFAFNSPVIYGSSGEPSDIETADVNFDGFPDFVITETNRNNINVFTNNKAGGFIGSVIKTIGSGGRFCLGDFNNDVKEDIATLCYDGYISLHHNKSVKITPTINQSVCSGTQITVKKYGTYPGFYWSPSGSVADSIIVSRPSNSL